MVVFCSLVSVLDLDDCAYEESSEGEGECGASSST